MWLQLVEKRRIGKEAENGPFKKIVAIYAGRKTNKSKMPVEQTDKKLMAKNSSY